MSELPPEQSEGRSPAPPQRPVVPYAAPGLYKHPTPRTPYVGRLAIGFFGYIVLAAACFAVGAVSSVETGWAAFSVMTVAALGVSLYLRIRYRFSGIGVGIILCLVLIPLGLILLLIAICGPGSKNHW